MQGAAARDELKAFRESGDARRKDVWPYEAWHWNRVDVSAASHIVVARILLDRCCLEVESMVQERVAFSKDYRGCAWLPQRICAWLGGFSCRDFCCKKAFWSRKSELDVRLESAFEVQLDNDAVGSYCCHCRPMLALRTCARGHQSMTDQLATLLLVSTCSNRLRIYCAHSCSLKFRNHFRELDVSSASSKSAL